MKFHAGEKFGKLGALLGVLVLLWQFPLHARGGVLERDTIFENEQGVILFEFDFIPDQVSVLRVPEHRRLEISGPSRSQQTSIVNGRVSRSFSLRFFVTAPGPGTYTVPSISIQVDGKTIESASQKLRVRKGNNPQAGRRTGIFDFGFPTRPRQRGEARVSLRYTNNKPYVGEVFGAEYILRVKNFEQPALRLGPGGLTKADLYSELYVVPDPEPARPSSGGGHEFVWPQKYLLVGQRPGPVRTEPQLVAVVDDGGLTRPIRLKVDPPSVNIRPLPAAGRPADFTGNVGSFSASLEKGENWKDTLNAFEPFKVLLRVTGRGNFIQFETPRLEATPGFRLVEARLGSRRFARDPLEPAGEIVFEFDINPEKAANISPGSVLTNWFDPGNGRYETIRLPIPSVHVKSAPAASAAEPAIPPEGRRLSMGTALLRMGAALAVALLLGGVYLFRARIPGYARAREFVDKTGEQLGARLSGGPGPRAERENDHGLRLLRAVCGTKRGVLLEEYLLDRGLAYADVERLKELSGRTGDTNARESASLRSRSRIFSAGEFDFLKKVAERVGVKSV